MPEITLDRYGRRRLPSKQFFIRCIFPIVLNEKDITFLYSSENLEDFWNNIIQLLYSKKFPKRCIEVFSLDKIADFIPPPTSVNNKPVISLILTATLDAEFFAPTNNPKDIPTTSEQALQLIPNDTPNALQTAGDWDLLSNIQEQSFFVDGHYFDYYSEEFYDKLQEQVHGQNPKIIAKIYAQSRTRRLEYELDQRFVYNIATNPNSDLALLAKIARTYNMGEIINSIYEQIVNRPEARGLKFLKLDTQLSDRAKARIINIMCKKILQFRNIKLKSQTVIN